MIDLRAINLNSLKVFTAVYSTRSMTEAAKVLFLTQSGVSQHIKSLEDDLEVQLFQRVGKRLIPTDAAQFLFKDTEQAFGVLSARLAKLHGAPQELIGVVRLGMPIEFGKNKLIPILSVIGRAHPKLQFEIVLDHAVTLSRLLLDGALDFAAVDEYPMDRRIEFEPIAAEKHLLCASREYVAKLPKIKHSKSFFESLAYVDYRRDEPVLRQWMLHHLKRKNLQLNVRAHIMDVQGVAKFITCGIGAGVLPDHVVDRLNNEGHELYVFESKARPLVSEIRLAKLRTVRLANAAEVAMNELKAALSAAAP